MIATRAASDHRLCVPSGIKLNSECVIANILAPGRRAGPPEGRGLHSTLATVEPVRRAAIVRRSPPALARSPGSGRSVSRLGAGQTLC
jgi:hypothetical protein